MHESVNVMRYAHYHKRAFTLIEVLVTVAVIALLIAILLPSLARARETTKTVTCASNLRQFMVAAHSYAYSYQDRYPIAYYNLELNFVTLKTVERQWDYTRHTDWSSGTAELTVKPGLLWQSQSVDEVNLCPKYDKKHSGSTDPYSGYNYNTSFIGHGESEQIVSPVRMADVKRPDQCAIFGDGEYEEGANKFMRAPFRDLEYGDLFSARHSGTQGYRHLKKTNVAFGDGHVSSLRERYTDHQNAVTFEVAEGTGFLSPDNHLYDLK